MCSGSMTITGTAMSKTQQPHAAAVTRAASSEALQGAVAECKDNGNGSSNSRNSSNGGSRKGVRHAETAALQRAAVLSWAAQQ